MQRRCNVPLGAARTRVRVAPVGWSRSLEEAERDDVEQNMCLLGLVGIYDPPRKSSSHLCNLCLLTRAQPGLESLGAAEECTYAGIIVHMFTGDHLGTTVAISRAGGRASRTRAFIYSTVLNK